MSCRQGILVWASERKGDYHRDGALFDPSTESWTMIPPAPFRPSFARGTAMAQGVLFFGGDEVVFEYDDQGRRLVTTLPTPRALLLDVDSLVWRELPSCPFGPRDYLTPFAADDVAYWWGLLGDTSWGWTDSPLVAFDMATETWIMPERQAQARKAEVATATPIGFAVWGDGPIRRL